VIESRRHVPVDEPDIITMVILPHLLKQHTAAFKGTMVLTCEKVAGELFAFDLQLADFL
jgi:hypothetical protein